MLMRYKILYDFYNYTILFFPLDYYFKFKFFYKSKFNVFYPLLIPRKETSLILKFFLIIYNKKFSKVILELGCGSGAICISLCFFFKFINFLALDLSFLSIKLSRLNLKIGKKIFYFFVDLDFIFCDIKKYNIIVSNPPYLSKTDIFDMHFESKKTLLAKNFGFFYLYCIINKSYDTLIHNGTLIIEHGYSQAKKVRRIMRLIGLVNIFTYKDLGYLNRVSLAEK